MDGPKMSRTPSDPNPLHPCPSVKSMVRRILTTDGTDELRMGDGSPKAPGGRASGIIRSKSSSSVFIRAIRGRNTTPPRHAKTARTWARAVFGMSSGGADYSAATSTVVSAAFFLAAFFTGGASSATATSSAGSSVAGRSTHSMIAIGAESLMRAPSLVMRQ